MKEELSLPQELDGKVWHYVFGGKSSSRGMHRHEELEVNLVTRGTAGYLLGNRKYELRLHSQVWLFPGQEHVLINPSVDYEMWIAVFKPRLIRHYCSSKPNRILLQANPAGEFCRDVAAPWAKRLSQFCSEVQAVQNDTARYNAGIAYILMSAWSIHCSTDSAVDSIGVHPSVKNAARLIRDGSDCDLKTLGREVGLSSWRLSRLFKEQTGVPLAEFRNRQRLQRFLDLYQNGEQYSLTEAALESGFGSYPQFHRVFRQAMNYPPAEHRRRIHEKKE